MSANAYNQTTLATVIVVTLSTNLRLAGRPGNVVVTAQASGLDRDSVANVTQISTIDRTQLLRRVGMVPSSVMHQIDSGLRLALEL